MNGKFQVMDPDSVHCTMTLVASLEEWKRVKKALDGADGSGHGPLWDFRHLIRSMVERVQEQFEGEHPPATERESP